MSPENPGLTLEQLEALSFDEINRYLAWHEAYITWNKPICKRLRRAAAPVLLLTNSILRELGSRRTRHELTKIAVWLTCLGKLPDISAYEICEVHLIWDEWGDLDNYHFPLRYGSYNLQIRNYV